MNKEWFAKYVGQPASLPPELKSGDTELYAYIDLGMDQSKDPGWLVLSSKRLSYHSSSGEVIEFERNSIREVEESQGQSVCSMLIRVAGPRVGIRGVRFRYSKRQAKAVTHIRFILDEEIQSPQERAWRSKLSADEVYEQSMAGPIQKVQSRGDGKSRSILVRLLSYLVPYKKELVWGGVAATLMTAVSLVPAYISGRLIDDVVRPVEKGELTTEDTFTIVVIGLVTMAVIYLFREIFLWIRLKTMAFVGEYVARDLRDDLYSHLQKLSVSYFSSKQTGSIISRVSSDTDRIWDFIAFGIVEVGIAFIMLLGLGTTLLVMDWQLGLLLTLPVPFILWSIHRHGEEMRKLFLRVWRKWSNLTALLSDTIPGIRVVKAFRQEKREEERFRNRNAIVIEEFETVHRVWCGFWPKLMLTVHALTVAAWCIGLPRVLGWESALGAQLSPGTFVSFLLYLTMYAQPIEIIGQMARMMNRAISSAYRIFEVLDAEPEIIERKDAVVLDRIDGEVEFEKVSFTYDGVRRILKDVSFKIEPGEMIGIVGPSGSGKTTLINLLSRFYDPVSGLIRVDGVNIRDLDLDSYRKQVGMVLQEPYLFHGTLVENIRYGNEKADLKDVVEAARAANAHDFICKLPQAYETTVGERGHTLSGGERQRISIARAILHNPRILILDEATSAVDTETERKIQEALDRLVKGRTVFAIAHRLSTLAKADRILVMKDGELKEMGTHDELLQNSEGVYSKLCAMQLELQSVV